VHVIAGPPLPRSPEVTIHVILIHIDSRTDRRNDANPMPLILEEPYLTAKGPGNSAAARVLIRDSKLRVPFMPSISHFLYRRNSRI
jgi:hypothetical protein